MKVLIFKHERNEKVGQLTGRICQKTTKNPNCIQQINDEYYEEENTENNPSSSKTKPVLMCMPS